MRRPLVIVAIAVTLTGCGSLHRAPDSAPPAPVVFVPTPPAAVVPPPPPPIVLLLDAARQAHREGDLDASVGLLDEALTLPGSSPVDRAWVRLELGLLRADPGSPLHDDAEAELQLTQLAEESPDSPATAIGEVLLRMIGQARAAARDAAAAAATGEQASAALAAARSDLARREQELERIKAILLGDPAP